MESNPLLKGALGLIHGYTLIVDENLKGTKSAKQINENTISISPAMWDLMKDTTQEELRFLLENIYIECFRMKNTGG